MTELVRLPYLGTAEEDVLFVEWFVGPGESVRRGQSLALVETLKATFEVEADCEGVLLHQLVTGGERVPVQTCVGLVGSQGEELSEEQIVALLEREAPQSSLDAVFDESPSTASPASRAPSGTPAPVAPAARRRAAELGIDLERVPGTGPDGLVRVADVERAHDGGGLELSAANGTLDPDFLTRLREDGEAFGRLSSGARLVKYRAHGALIGDDCHLGAGTVLWAERLVLGDGTHFGADCSLEARDFEAGRLLHFGPRCRIRCNRVRIGDNAFFTEDVEIGGGGAMDPEAELVVGSHGFVGEHVHLNPCRTLRLGDEVVISRSAVIMTHSFGGSILRGFPNRFAGTTIGDGAQIGIGAVLFPGLEVGAGSIVLSGSSLVSSVPAGRLYGGVPAVDMKAAATPLTPRQFDALALELVEEFARQLQLRGFEGELACADGETRFTVRANGQGHLLRFAASGLADDTEAGEMRAEELRVCSRYDRQLWESLPPEVAGIDLSVPAFRGPAGPLSDAFREFLRKRGVRLRPRAWAYRGGWL